MVARHDKGVFQVLLVVRWVVVDSCLSLGDSFIESEYQKSNNFERQLCGPASREAADKGKFPGVSQKAKE